MGLAASQARWLGLTARKTNVEYEGQQINQARLALSNQSSELWNKLYSMEVPTAPSKTDYTKTQYTFQDGDTTYTLSNIASASYTDPEGITYNSYVTYTKEIEQYKGIRNIISDPQVQYNTEGQYYMIGTKKCTSLADVEESERTTYEAQLDQIEKDWPEAGCSQAWANYQSTGDEKYLQQIQFYTNENNETCYTTSDELDSCIGSTGTSLKVYYADTEKSKQEVSKYAIIDYDSSGRATNMQLEGSSYVYSLDASTVTDENAYNDAMNSYNYQKQVYDQTVQNINAKTEQIQTEDRTLELRLKELDTEQEALQTEMETIKKVISKNIDNTFKTFDS